MNLVVLLVGFRVWRGSPVEIITRTFCALSLLALEMQLVTWTGVGSLHTLVAFNAVAAIGLFWWLRQQDRGDAPASNPWPWAGGGWLPFAAVGALVLLLNAALPLEAADPYHLERVDRIHQLGTLAYDPAAHPKTNVLGWLYELTLADLRAIPVVGQLAVRFHGAIGVVLYTVTSAALLQVLGTSSRMATWLLAVVPVAFHQFVMVKNDLFGALPGVLVLVWTVARAREARPLEGAWAGWLAGTAIGIKQTSFPVGLVFGGALLLERRRDARFLAASLAGMVVGVIASGMMFVLVENVSVYGAALAPYASLGNRTAGIGEAALSAGRFGLSLLDMGLLTRTWWSGRGGWGGTYGLPVIWALMVLLFARQTSLARRTLLVCGAYWLAFAAVYPDADVAHRLALAPGLLLIAVAATLSTSDSHVPRWLGRFVPVVVALSALQIVRSAVLYFARS